jgi:hypothetical protein
MPQAVQRHCLRQLSTGVDNPRYPRKKVIPRLRREAAEMAHFAFKTVDNFSL